MNIINLKKSLGAGMIEVLVALLILGVGLLGVLSLQANGLNSGQRAEFVGQAQVLAQDMADRIMAFGSQQSNSNLGAVGGEYDGIDTDDEVESPNCQAPSGSGCSSALTLQYDSFEWRQLVNASGLPNSRGTVDWSAGTSGGTYTITVYWDQNRTNPEGRGCDSLTCFEMDINLRNIAP